MSAFPPPIRLSGAGAPPAAALLDLLDGSWTPANQAGITLDPRNASGAHPVTIAAQAARPIDEVARAGALWERPLRKVGGAIVTAADLPSIAPPRYRLDILQAPAAQSSIAVVWGLRDSDGDVWACSGIGHAGNTGGLYAATSLLSSEASNDNMAAMAATHLIDQYFLRIVESYGQNNNLNRSACNGAFTAGTVYEFVGISIGAELLAPTSLQMKFTRPAPMHDGITVPA